MRTVKDAELTKLQSEQSFAMQDLCHIHHISRASGTYGTHSSQTRTSVTGVACGIEFPKDLVRNLKQGNVQTSPQLLIMDYDCILRLTATQPILLTDEVELVEKGEFLISGTFRPVNPPTVNSTVQKVQLKRVVP